MIQEKPTKELGKFPSAGKSMTQQPKPVKINPFGTDTVQPHIRPGKNILDRMKKG